MLSCSHFETVDGVLKGNTRDLHFKWLLGNDELCKEPLKEHVRKWISKENQEGDNIIALINALFFLIFFDFQRSDNKAINCIFYRLIIHNKLIGHIKLLWDV